VCVCASADRTDGRPDRRRTKQEEGRVVPIERRAPEPPPPGCCTCRHPVAVAFALAFKAAALATYLLCTFFTDSFVVSFVVVVLLLAFDFWTVKNISGRILVGLRWWNEIGDDGASKWHFESIAVRSPSGPSAAAPPPPLTPSLLRCTEPLRPRPARRLLLLVVALSDPRCVGLPRRRRSHQIQLRVPRRRLRRHRIHVRKLVRILQMRQGREAEAEQAPVRRQHRRTNPLSVVIYGVCHHWTHTTAPMPLEPLNNIHRPSVIVGHSGATRRS